MKFCYIKKSNEGAAGFISMRGKIWENGKTIKYYFFDATASQVTSVTAIMTELEAIVNVKFERVNDPNDSDIRIAFIPKNGSWSYLGTDALSIPKDRPTINFGWDIRKDKATIRHELGHMLGLGHEHSNPDGRVKWDKQAVIDDMTKRGWTIEDIEHNIFRVYASNEIEDNTKRDKYSVMHYFFPPHWTITGETISKNDDWSEEDIKGLQDMYPFPEDETDCDKYRHALMDLFTKKVVYYFPKHIIQGVASKLDINPDSVKSELIKAIIQKLKK